MPFIGNQPALSYTSFAKQDFTTSATTSYTLDNPVTNENEIALFINFVRQEPTTAYTASGTSLTLTSATSASDDMYCVFLGKAVQTVNPPNGSVGTAQIADLAITSGKLASGVLPTNTPAFEATITTEQNPADGTDTKINFDNETFDTDGAYDTTNKRFTVPSGQAGKYHFYCDACIGGSQNSDLTQSYIYVYKNGVKTTLRAHFNTNLNGNGRYYQLTLGTTMQLVAGDYIEMFGRADLNAGTVEIRTPESRFGGYKIIE
jgi:hypothetical protein